ncbi:hypothetical protein BCT84_10125 [Vibrio breoganii]|nr:hypothetical protein BCT84_10125 [Vibrio breoganii]
MVSSIVGCIMAVLGILTLGVVFCPIALVCAIIGLINATSAEESNSLGINMLAWILTIIGFVTSPVLLGIIGLSAL